MPDNIKQNPQARDKEIDNLVKFVIDEKAKTDYPNFRSLGVPNSVIDENGKIKNYKEGDSDIKINNKIKAPEQIDVRDYGDKQHPSESA